MDHSPEAIQLPRNCSRAFWNSQLAAPPPQLDPFDESLLVPAMTGPDPLEACSSTFQHLFPSTLGSSTCEIDSDDHQFGITPISTHQRTKFTFVDDNSPRPEGEGGAGAEESESFATAQSYNCTNVVHSEYSSQFTWSFVPPSPSSPPHHHHPHGAAVSTAALSQTASANSDPNRSSSSHVVSNPNFELGGGDQSSQELVCLDPADFFEPLGPGNGSSKNQVRSPFSKAPPAVTLRELPSLINRRQVECTGTKLANSWPLMVTPPSASLLLDQRNIGPLGSPCSVVSGAITKTAQRIGDDQRVASDHYVNINMMATTGSGPSSSSHGGVQHRPVAQPTLKRKSRSMAPKNSNEVESQRMTHIAVERNRRKQMNEHLAALRALMPGSYVHKGDQASIVGGAIEFVKELEHLLVCLQSQKRRRAYSDLTSPKTPTSRLTMPFNPDSSAQHNNQIVQAPFSLQNPQILGVVGEARSEVASVEVRVVGAEQAVVKVMALRRSGQLLRTVVALESLALTVMHANITTVNHTVLYSFQAHAGPLCRLNPHEIAAALHQTFSSLHSLQF